MYFSFYMSFLSFPPSYPTLSYPSLLRVCVHAHMCMHVNYQKLKGDEI